MTDKTLLQDLSARGLIAQMTSEEELEQHLAEGSVTLYCGFDPTADSLHIGSLVPLLALKRFQQAGHKPLALVGGATGLIGDPSFKAQERKLNDDSTVAGWVEKLKGQVSQFIDFDCGENSAEVVNNLDWTRGMDILTFLRDVGKHFSVNQMIAKESVKQRIDREGEGISFTEFTYMILQSYDYQQLNASHGCTLQIGGSDQWGNITGGTELTRRMNGNKAFGLTLPLITKSDGTKFGKTESGTIWLSSAKTSPYAFYQFWLQTNDADVYNFLRYFTFLSIEEIDALEKADAEREGRPEAQSVLAREVTRLVHGEEGLVAAMRITDALFSGNLSDLSEADFEQLQLDGLPSSSLTDVDLAETPLTTLLSDAGLAASGKQIKDALQRNAVIVNGAEKGMDDNMKAAEVFAAANGTYSRFFLVKLGKKKHHLFVI
ncbi:tyrosine--tRNA ligase [Amphritea pacifica]|uniref:Tyrosine--tRNA ligase n=1 Tax=Amphritea pacifica TaxID=2811233 RepID=A0ABS2WBZ2_9GAMM|nr:tyrosine--tRNA ligase [Amphritea pacifica]MBN0989240.1 tyrosine--tRNA ligase [Amphritea pacifica]MBN1008529.1 tyrosine--tRNA ligase [Amphritea pacifica]